MLKSITKEFVRFCAILTVVYLIFNSGIAGNPENYILLEYMWVFYVEAFVVMYGLAFLFYLSDKKGN